MTNQEAGDIVHGGPRTGAAKRLIKKALQEAARKGQLRYEELVKINNGDRRYFHDDITAVVVFLDHESPGNKTALVPQISIQGCVDTDRPSKFTILQDGVI
ncbi:hypothetical protein Nepgr_031190 [Nepenthes gracilis]|uniref:Uncharacterized protein n=1 Tax=Nepenthes gracilis TaxID=150966 RepID=A0AAD3TH25_NEPGR|nr:hypothetical protein Nepgr_031190 [Nepenthes gracilis]